MNYLRGAVNVIAAPYNYYSNLSPINPSTLTGAIDVIVVQRPSESGEPELVCSPFHVRFGKWQVLRPGEKKVNVSVNGHLIPFSMKIGEAGEAFFVFETDDDVPEELITSPIIQPTHLEEAQNTPNVPTDRFGAKRDPDDVDLDRDATAAESAQEPEFLDLNAMPSGQDGKEAASDDPKDSSLLSSLTSSAAQVLPSPPASPIRAALATPASLLASTEAKFHAMHPIDTAVNAAHKIKFPGVTYKEDVALDGMGYHSGSHAREDSEKTVNAEDYAYAEEAQPVASGSSSRLNTPTSSRPSSPVASPRPNDVAVSFPPIRASTELLEDSIGLAGPLNPQVEYSWEWGAFPQPSPMKATFSESKSSKGKGKARLEPVLSDAEDDLLDTPTIFTRSHSVPPEADQSPSRSKLKSPTTKLSASPESSDEESGSNDEEPADSGFGHGGLLTASRGDPTRFAVFIEGRKSSFELSVVAKAGNGPLSDVFDGRDEINCAGIFDQDKVTYKQFLDDEEVIQHPCLVIRWAGSQYITREDASPLMDALILWRNSSLTARARGIASRPSSPPMSEDEDILSSGDERQNYNRSQSEPPQALDSSMQRPSSSSWSRWWSRRDVKEANSGRPLMRGATYASQHDDSPIRSTSQVAVPTVSTSPPKDLAPPPPIHRADSSPAPAPTTPPVPAAESAPGKRFAKTLRLTSDQLKALNLKPGANSITFSLSASGAIACTARIFVWDSTDVVLISDIDGTITKSDGLGHVFAMIGRDWTHLGVAKLYTDITRNGYKIMYLTSRAIGQADATRDYLKGIKQNDYQLPEGPVIMSPDRLMTSLHREVVLRKPEVFKMACLRDIQKLFGEASRNPFYAGFGNRITDALSYRSVNVPSSRIFTIDSGGEVKMELLELAGYKSSYIHMTDLVDQMFPPIHRKWTPEFTDFNFWKVPVQDFPLPDFSPPSPALSARSDTSNQSTLARLRNFSLVGNRQANTGRQSSLPGSTTGDRPSSQRNGESTRSSHLRQMSSFERLSSTLGFGDGGSSPSHSSTALESEDDMDSDEERQMMYERDRRRSTSSMPGSLDDIHFGEDEDHEQQQDEQEYDHEGDDDDDDDGEDAEDAAEDAFDEDFFAAGEMKNVPFL